MNEEELEQLLLELLHTIRQGDMDRYFDLSSKKLTCFEPETQGALVTGLPFHLFMLDHFKATAPYHLELINPQYHIFEEIAYAVYSLIITSVRDGEPVIRKVNETRIFKKFDDNWKMVHFHRS